MCLYTGISQDIARIKTAKLYLNLKLYLQYNFPSPFWKQSTFPLQSAAAAIITEKVNSPTLKKKGTSTANKPASELPASPPEYKHLLLMTPIRNSGSVTEPPHLHSGPREGPPISDPARPGGAPIP
ncbi:hypothetical protein CEXT_445231 [Caerostris extrusa]|uniref:Uncharacterized protein n=1 Tax=Caerostris extrusa TaxID=172846 RepID=A0AAV4XDL3_CAEEX|nr:hypothetical protein CEXT_445231 [Caerostris extrusa]